MIKQYFRLVPLLFLSVLFLLTPPQTQAAGNCNTTSPRKYVYVYFYDENGVTWSKQETNPCLPAAQVSARTPVDITRPDQPHTPQENWMDTHGNRVQWQCGSGSIARAQARTFRSGCFPANAMMYLGLRVDPPYDINASIWEYRHEGEVITSGVGSRAEIPLSEMSFSNSENELHVQMVLLTTDIQGFKVKMPGNIVSEPTSSQTITLADGPTTLATTTANPYYFLDLDPQPTYTVSAAQPAVNYSVGYTLCYNATNCHTSGITLGNSVQVNSPGGGYTDLWWHYWEYIGWYRLKQTSFTAQTGIVNFIPPDVVKYDNWDTDEELLSIFPPTEPDAVGLITSTGSIDIGPNTSKVSNKNWAKTNYAANKGYLANLGSFLSYAKARKEIKQVANMGEVESDKINIFVGDVILEHNTFNSSQDNFVLIVQGNLRFQSGGPNQFNPSRQSRAFIATGQIRVDPAIQELHGIFIANSFDLAYGSTTSATPLKVTGNLISNTPIYPLKRNRPVNQYQQASLYVVGFPEFYFDLVPHLSTIIQEGRQLQ